MAADLVVHVGHNVEVEAWGRDVMNPDSVSITCYDCNEILHEEDVPHMKEIENEAVEV